MSPRFVADCMLGRLAKWLRALGFDVVYDPFAGDDQVVAWAREGEAVLLTRDTRLANAPGVRVIFIKHDQVGDQVRQVVEEAPLDLSQARPLTRCTVCNGELRAATRDEVWQQVPSFVYLTQERYARCEGCGRVYWEGTHVSRIAARIAELMGQASGGRR